MGKPTDGWLSFDSAANARRDISGLALVELITPRPASKGMIKEFLNPPAAGSLGKMGELVLILSLIHI